MPPQKVAFLECLKNLEESAPVRDFVRADSRQKTRFHDALAPHVADACERSRFVVPYEQRQDVLGVHLLAVNLFQEASLGTLLRATNRARFLQGNEARNAA